MSRPPGVLTKKLISLWVITIAAVAAIWGLTQLDAVVPDDLVWLLGVVWDWHINTIATPYPETFAALFCLCGVGSLLLLGNIVLRLRDSDQTINFGSLLITLGAVGAAGYFAYEVLSNDEAAIPIVGQVEKPPEPAKTIRLFSLNVLHGYPEFAQQRDRLETAARILRHFGADVMIFQEVCNTNEYGNMAERLNLARKLNHTYARANGSRSLIGFEEGAAIVSGLPIIESKRLLLKPREPWWENRIALATRLNLGGGETLKVVGVHLSNSASADAQAEYLIEIMDESSPDIIAGDFNSTADSPAVQAILKHGYSAVTPTKAIHGAVHFDMPNKLVSEPAIDHVFLSNAFRERYTIAFAAWVVTSKAVTDDPTHARIAVSDHNALLVDLKRR